MAHSGVLRELSCAGGRLLWVGMEHALYIPGNIVGQRHRPVSKPYRS